MLKLPVGGHSPKRSLVPTSVGFATSLILVVFLSLLTGCGGGTPPGSDLLVQPASVDFGTLQTNGTSTARVLTVTNVTFSPVEIQTVSVAPTTTFTIQKNRAPLILAPRASLELTVQFAPRAAGSYSGTLTIVGHQLSSASSALGFSGNSEVKSTLHSASWPGPVALPRTISVTLFGKGDTTAPGNPGNSGSSGNGSGGSKKIAVSISPTSLNMESGGSAQFGAAVTGTNNTAVTWTAVMGTISSSGSYTAPRVPGQTVDTVSAISVADPSKYDNATVVVQGGSAGPFTIANQQPISTVPDATSLFGMRLPADIMSHLYANSDVIAQQMLAASKPPNGNFTGMIWAHAGHRNDINGIPTYYGQASDPVYVITGGTSPTGQHSAINIPFHAPNRAQTSGATSEQYFTVWDQAQDIMISFYTCCGKGTQILPNCTSTSLSNPCPIGINPLSMKTTLSDPQPYGIGGGNPWSSSSIFAPVGEIRVQELIQGHIYHPIVMNVVCQAPLRPGSMVGAAVFPDTAGYGAGSCNLICPPSAGCTSVNNPPSAGMLVFLDYSDSDLAQLQSYLPAWQYPIIEALTRYGGYLGDTGNALHPSRLESDNAYATAGVTNPFWSWIQGQPGTNSGCGPNGDCVLYWNRYNGTYGSCPASPTPNLCDVSKHLHVADPCVAKGMAGLSAAQGACFQRGG